MQVFGIIYVAILFVFSFFLAIGGYILRKDNVRRSVWRRPELMKIENAGGFKAFCKK